jgi:hypothetical protein
LEDHAQPVKGLKLGDGDGNGVGVDDGVNVGVGTCASVDRVANINTPTAQIPTTANIVMYFFM